MSLNRETVAGALNRFAHISEAEDVNPQSELNFRNAFGLIVMCMYCQRTQSYSVSPPHWQRIEEFVSNPPRRVSHGLCPECLDKYSPGSK